MSKSHFAGIDIGSNAVRLLIKCLNEPGSIEPLSKVQLVRVPLRLGEEAFTEGRISKKKGKQLVSLMKAYKELMEIYEVEAFRACATSAMRDAANGPELVEKIFEKTGINIEIIEGREEARLISADLMQYAGVKDKNGVEIYEGDILLDDFADEYYIVKFFDGVFIAECDGVIYDLADVALITAVVGNIYENSELVEESGK